MFTAREKLKINHSIQMNYITIAQIALSVILIILITLQESSDTPGVFGGGGSGNGGFYQQRRGLEKVFFGMTIACVALFIVLALLNLVLPTLQNLF